MEPKTELRDYIAAKAMTALMPIYREMFMDGTYNDWYGDAVTQMTKSAYVVADDMLKARELK